MVGDTDSHITFTEENTLDRPTMVDKRAMQDAAEKELQGHDNIGRRQVVKLATFDLDSLYDEFHLQYNMSLSTRLHGETGESVP